jgi:hypothetical protein
MRQVYLTVGGSWGQILAGREIGLFQRQNILTDQTLFGIGATGGINSIGTTLGRIGFGYVYPNFVPQMTYSTAAGRPGQLSIGIFAPAGLGGDAGTVYGETQVPRVEAEGTWKRERPGNGRVQDGDWCWWRVQVRRLDLLADRVRILGQRHRYDASV